MLNFIYFVFLKVNQLFSAVVLSKYFEDSYLFDILPPISSWFQSTRFPYVALIQIGLLLTTDALKEGLTEIEILYPRPEIFEFRAIFILAVLHLLIEAYNIILTRN